MVARSITSTQVDGLEDKTSGPSRLQIDLAARILRHVKDQNAGPGYHLIELELCQHFAVSRTPVRGALKLLADQGYVEPRAHRGYVLTRAVDTLPEIEAATPADEGDRELFIAIAQARNSGALAAQTTQQEIVRLFGAKLPQVLRVLRRMSDMKLVERKAGNGWSFMASIDSARAQAESYAFRHAIEPALLLQPTFELDRDWLAVSRARHEAFRRRNWRDSLAVEFYEMNSDFHEQLARCSGNRFMLAAVQQQIQLRTFLNYQWEYGVERVRESIDEHLEIMDALESGKNKKASALMEAHLQTSAVHSVMHDVEE